MEVCESAGAVGAANGDITGFKGVLELVTLDVAFVVIGVTAAEDEELLVVAAGVVDVTALAGADFLLLAARCFRPLLAALGRD